MYRNKDDISHDSPLHLVAIKLLPLKFFTVKRIVGLEIWTIESVGIITWK